MPSSEMIAEVRRLLADYGLSKWELVALLILLAVLLRLPTILTHRREMAKIKADFAVKSASLQAKIEDTRTKRALKASKGRAK